MTMTVVIPAHDESAVIGACLSSIIRQDSELAVHVVVAANGCHDSTADVARTYIPEMRQRGHLLEVREIATASKPAALNAGDVCARHADKVYLDADIELSDNALSSIGAAFVAGVQFCAPEIELRAHTYFGRAYGRVWRRLPYVANDVVGAGLYAVSAAGRQRWDCFPHIVADDKFARLHFDRMERVVLEGSHFVVHLPAGFTEIVRVRSRWIRANRQLKRECPEIAGRDRERLTGMLRFLLSNVSLWRDLPAFLLVYWCAELRSWVTQIGARGSPLRWERASRARHARRDS